MYNHIQALNFENKGMLVLGCFTKTTLGRLNLHKHSKQKIFPQHLNYIFHKSFPLSPTSEVTTLVALAVVMTELALELLSTSIG